MLTSAQRELDDARDSLLTLETRRKRLGVPDITPNTDDMELPDDVSLLSEDHAHSVGSRSTMFIGLIGGVTDDDKSSGFSFKNYTSKLFAVSSARTASTAPTEHTQDDNEDARSRASARSTAAALEKEDEEEIVEYAIFRQTLKDHYSPPRKETETTEETTTTTTNITEETTTIANFEPIQIDMVTMDTIIEEPADPEDGVAVIEVTECGIQQINGSYLKFDSRDGVPTYSKIDKFDCHETMFTIGRWAATNGNRKWYITAIVPGQSPPMKSVFYVVYSASNVPPKEGWMVVDEGFDLFLTPEFKEKGVPDAPKLHWEANDDGVVSVANTNISRRSSVSNSHYYEVGQQVLNVLTREK